MPKKVGTSPPVLPNVQVRGFGAVEKPAVQPEQKGRTPNPPTPGGIPQHLTQVPQKHVPIPQRDPVAGVEGQMAARVSEKLSTPKGPNGMTPREFADVLQFDTGHAKAVGCIGDPALIDRLKAVGTTVDDAKAWRQFFWDVARVSAERGSPNPSAAGRAVLLDWVVTQLGGSSVGPATLREWLASDPRVSAQATDLAGWISAQSGRKPAVEAWLSEA